jgi:ABC-type methionine transport system ATPase subunit
MVKKAKKTVKRQMMFTFPEKLITEPLIYNLGIKFNVVTNIRRADVTNSKGWVVLELEGEENDIEKGIAWMTGKGVRVDPVVGDIVEG